MVIKRKGAGTLGRTEKYRKGNKKKGSRKVGENGEVSEWLEKEREQEWCREWRIIRMERKRKGTGDVGRTETIQNAPFVQNKL